jgi:hypothetical protein
LEEYMKLKDAKRKYKGEWLAFQVKKEGEEEELEGKLLSHTKGKKELHQNLRKKKTKKAYITYAGPIVKPGYAVIF